MPFAKGGQPGPGRPKGSSRNLTLDKIKRVVEPEVPAIMAKLVEKALEGDMAALRIVCDRVWPVQTAQLAEVMAELEELRELVRARTQLRVA